MDVRSLAGRTALVTGGASGIGRAAALAFAKRGADVFVCDLDEPGLKQLEADVAALGRTAITCRADVSNLRDMEDFADVVHREVEAVDILMNNAGVAVIGNFQATTLEDWDWILGINVKGVVHGAHYFVPPMVRRARGHVINVASAAAYMATEQLSAYTATKFAVLGLSESMRLELGRAGIGVTAVCPGVINTPIVAAARMRGARGTPAVKKKLID